MSENPKKVLSPIFRGGNVAVTVSREELNFLNILRIPKFSSDNTSENLRKFSSQAALYLSQKIGIGIAPPALDPSLKLRENLPKFTHREKLKNILDKADPSAKEMLKALKKFHTWRRKIEKITDTLPSSILLTEPLPSSSMLKLTESLITAMNLKDKKEISKLKAEILAEHSRRTTEAITYITAHAVSIFSDSKPLKKRSMEMWASSNFELDGDPKKFNQYCCTNTHDIAMLKSTLVRSSRLDPASIFYETPKGIVTGKKAVKQILRNLAMRSFPVAEVYDVIEAIKKTFPNKFDGLCEQFAKENPQYSSALLEAEGNRRALAKTEAFRDKLQAEKKASAALALQRNEEKPLPTAEDIPPPPEEEPEEPPPTAEEAEATLEAEAAEAERDRTARAQAQAQSGHMEKFLLEEIRRPHAPSTRSGIPTKEESKNLRGPKGV